MQLITGTDWILIVGFLLVAGMLRQVNERLRKIHNDLTSFRRQQARGDSN
jgi:hypothetical protein